MELTDEESKIETTYDKFSKCLIELNNEEKTSN